jgi:hypothetical protein
MAIVGDEVSTEIGGPRVVGEHQWTTGKLVQVLAGAEVVRCGLSTGGWCTAGEEEDDGDGMQLGHWELGAGVSKTANECGCGAAAREREGVKALQRAVHDGEEVAAGDGSGTSWRAWEKPPGERKEVETGRGGRVDEFCSWRWRSGRGIDGERRWQERRREGSGACQRKTKQGVSGGLIRKFQRVQGPHCNLKFSYCYKGQIEKCST